MTKHLSPDKKELFEFITSNSTHSAKLYIKVMEYSKSNRRSFESQVECMEHWFDIIQKSHFSASGYFNYTILRKIYSLYDFSRPRRAYNQIIYDLNWYIE